MEGNLVRGCLKIDTGGPAVEDGFCRDGRNGFRVLGETGASPSPKLGLTFGFRMRKPFDSVVDCVGISVGTPEVSFSPLSKKITQNA